jgi:hypothetical protein
MRKAVIKGNDRKEQLIDFCVIEDIDVSFILPWHMRLSADDKGTIDVYPTSLRTFTLDNKKWKSHNNINELKQYLKNKFKNNDNKNL